MVTAVIVFCLLAGGFSAALLSGFGRARGSGPRYGSGVPDTLGAAFLSGGPGRVVDAVISEMCADGRLAIDGPAPGFVRVVRREVRNPVEEAVFAAQATAPDGILTRVRVGAMLGRAVRSIEEDLVARGFLSDPEALRRYRSRGEVLGILSLSGLPVAGVLTALAFFKHVLPVPLALAAFLTVVACAWVGLHVAGAARGGITAYGREALAGYGRTNGHRRDPAHLVAVGGPRAAPDETVGTYLSGARPHGSGGSRGSRSPGVYNPLVLPSSSYGGGGGGGGDHGGGGGDDCGGGGGGGCGGGGGGGCGGGGGGGCGGGGGGGGGC